MESRPNMKRIKTMEPILDGNLEIQARVRSNHCYLFKAFYLIDRSHTSDSFLRNDLFSFMLAQHVLSYHLK